MGRHTGPRRTTSVGLAVVVAVGLGVGAHDSQAQGNDGAYRLDESWPTYPQGSQFEMGSGIAVDARGVVYAISRDRDHWAGHPLAMTRYRGTGSIWMSMRAERLSGNLRKIRLSSGPTACISTARALSGWSTAMGTRSRS